jgi:hypothetical protein
MEEHPLLSKRRAFFFKQKHLFAQAFDTRGYPLIAESLRECSETETLVACSNCGTSWWEETHCQLRVCPLCSWKVARERAAYVTKMTHHMQHPKMITLTMPNWKTNPKAGVTTIRAAFNKLRRSVVFKEVKGGAYQIEVKRGSEGWHIHIHALVDAPYLPYQLLWSVWRAVTQIPCPQVDVRSAPTDRARQYLCKYATKTVGFDAGPDAIVDWYEATKGLRLWTTFGCWYNKPLDELDHDTPVTKPAYPCPHCGAEGTVYRARDGPYIYGHDIWQTIEAKIIPDGLTMRGKESVKEALAFYRQTQPAPQEIAS